MHTHQPCGRPWSVCEVVLVPNVNAVTVMRVQLFVLDVCMRGKYEGAYGVPSVSKVQKVRALLQLCVHFS